MKPVSLKK